MLEWNVTEEFSYNNVINARAMHLAKHSEDVWAVLPSACRPLTIRTAQDTCMMVNKKKVATVACSNRLKYLIGENYVCVVRIGKNCAMCVVSCVKIMWMWFMQDVKCMLQWLYCPSCCQKLHFGIGVAVDLRCCWHMSKGVLRVWASFCCGLSCNKLCMGYRRQQTIKAPDWPK